MNGDSRVLYICENWFHVEHLGLESSLMRLAASSLFSILYLYFVVMSFLNLSEHWAGLFVLPYSLVFGEFLFCGYLLISLCILVLLIQYLFIQKNKVSKIILFM